MKNRICTTILRVLITVTVMSAPFAAWTSRATAQEEPATVEEELELGPVEDEAPTTTTTTSGTVPTGDPTATTGDPATTTATGGNAADSSEDVLNQVKPPELITFNDAKLPPELDIPDGDYTVVLTLTIDENGTVTEATSVSSQRPELVEPAQKAALLFKFKPAFYQDKPVLVQVQYEYQFQVRLKVRNIVYVFSPVEKGSRDPISDVSGFIEENGATFTSIEGRMEVSNLAPGTYTLYIPTGQYEEVRKEFTIKAGDKDPPKDTLYLKKAYGTQANQTIIRAPREARFAAKQSLSAGELVSFPGAGGDVLKVVENLPGIARSPLGLGTLIVYGSPPMDTLVYLNAMPFISLYHFGGLYSVINSEFIDSIDFIPAGFDASFGRAIGGVVDVKLKDEPLTGIHGAVDVNLLHAGIVIGGPYSKDGDIQAAFRRSYYDAIIGALPLGDAGLKIATAPRYYDYQFRLQHRFGTQHKLTFFINGTDDSVEVINYDNDNNPQFIGSSSLKLWSHNMQASWTWEPTSNITNDLKVQVAIADSTINVFDQINFAIRQYPVYIRDNLKIRARDNVTVRTGLDMMFDSYTYDITAPQVPTDGGQMAPLQAEDFISAQGKGLMIGLAPWVSVEWKPVPRLTIVPSLRADFYLGSWQAWTIDPRLSVTVDVVPDKLNFRFAGGLYGQPAPPYAYTKEFGNPNIKPEYAVHVLAGFEYSPIDRLTLSANGFYKYFFNRVQTSEDRTLVYDNKTTGRAYGCDILLRMNPGGSIPLTGWIAYTYLRAEIYDRVTGTYRPSNYQQSHNLNIFVNYKLPKNWSLGARFRLSSGYPYTKSDSFVYDSDNDTYISVPSANVNGEELPLFHQLDIRIDKEWIFNKWKLGLYLEVQNVYFHKNPEGLMNNYDYSKTGYLSGIPILPVLGIKGSF